MPVTRDFSVNILTKNDKESGPHKVYAIAEVENKICFLVQTSPDMECRWIPTNRCEIIDKEFVVSRVFEPTPLFEMFKFVTVKMDIEEAHVLNEALLLYRDSRISGFENQVITNKLIVRVGNELHRIES